MCGIVGIASRSSVPERDWLVQGRDAMRHRGPDDAGVWWSADGRVGLGHRRLSILDLSDAAHQPMQDAHGMSCIVFNGEIYNHADLREELAGKGHSFRSRSDTEVILAAYREWGVECVSRLAGMFSFAICDIGANRLFLARDRAGEKPLYYAQRGDRLAFASELKALMADPALPRRVSAEALEHYLAFGQVPGGLCMLEGVLKLPPAHALLYDVATGDLKTWQYWRLPPQDAVEDVSDEELTDELERLLLSSVRRQMVADVPVGILLSGGIDSSLVTAMAARASSRPVKTFTITFPGHGAYDEGPHARLVSRHFGTDHTEMAAEPATVELLPMLARQFDEPMCDSSMIPTYLVSRLIRRHATVALGGDGGDELFGGYPSYGWVFHQSFARRWIPSFIRTACSAGADAILPTGFRGRNFLLGLSGGMDRALSRSGLYFGRRERQQLLAPIRSSGAASEAGPEQYRKDLCDMDRGLPGMAMAVDFQSYLPDDILVKVDRASMLASLEVRAPFLDHRVIEFAFRRVPNRLRATSREHKILPRRLAARRLPPELDLTRKQGFSLPLGSWLKGEWGAFVEQVLTGPRADLFDRTTVRRLLDGQRRGRNNIERLFALTLFELWRREYRMTVA